MSWREKLAALSPDQRLLAQRLIDEEDDELERELLEMSDEQLTLWLARQGTSPEDSRRALEKAMVRFRAALRVAQDEDAEKGAARE